jgi:hypothetical protein
MSFLCCKQLAGLESQLQVAAKGASRRVAFVPEVLSDCD